MITGFCFGSASTADQPLAETFFALRAAPDPRLVSVGSAFSGLYVADKGFEGVENHRRWLECYGAEVIHPPKRNSKKPWPKRLRRWVASIRQIVEIETLEDIRRSLKGVGVLLYEGSMVGRPGSGTKRKEGGDRPSRRRGCRDGF